MNAKSIAIIASLASALLSGCSATPTKPRDRIGDFVTNIGAATQTSGTSRA
jgi:hypothetical protein